MQTECSMPKTFIYPKWQKPFKKIPYSSYLEIKIKKPSLTIFIYCVMEYWKVFPM